jgi:hypothetical protein
MSIYNLNEDCDEIYNVPYASAKKNTEFTSLMNSLGEEWYALLKELYNDSLFLKSVKNPEEYRKILSDYKELISTDRRISKDDFDKLVANKNMIVFFDDLDMAEKMLCALSDKCNLIEIWTDNTEIKSICGHKCIHPHNVMEEVEFVVCSSNEIMALAKMNEFNIENYILWKNVTGNFKGL